jgi:hypothetical protein
MNNFTTNTDQRKPSLWLRAAADGLHARVHQAEGFERVSSDMWCSYLASLNSYDREQWRQAGRAA